MAGGELRRGPWTVEKDLLLVNNVAAQGEGSWNSLVSRYSRTIGSNNNPINMSITHQN
jgi:hypothetical protein